MLRRGQLALRVSSVDVCMAVTSAVRPFLRQFALTTGAMTTIPTRVSPSPSTWI
jgi:hypothetical protein